MEQPHSTQYFSDLILSPTDKFKVPNVHIILLSVAFTFACIKFASLGRISSLVSAAKKKIWKIIKAKSQNDWTQLTASPTDWATIHFAIIYWNATGHQTVRIMDFDVAFDWLTMWIINNRWIIESIITYTRMTTMPFGKHFLTFYIFFVLQKASCLR